MSEPEPLVAGSLRCPACGACQPEERPVCMECGMHFTAKILILAARRPLGLPVPILAVLGGAALLLLAASVLFFRPSSRPGAARPDDLFKNPVPATPPPASVRPAPAPAPVVPPTPGVTPPSVPPRGPTTRAEWIRVWDRDFPMLAAGASASIPLLSGGTVTGQISMIGSTGVIVVSGANRDRVAFADMTPEIRLRLDSAFRSARMEEDLRNGATP